MGSTLLYLLFSFERSRSWAYSSAWLERTPDKREVGGSSPPRPTMAEIRRQMTEDSLIWRKAPD